MKRLLLTGIGGSIGVHTFAHIMHNTDWEVVGIDSFRHKGWCDRLHEMLREHPDWSNRLVLIVHDLTAPFSKVTKKWIKHVDHIISMAALSDVEASIEDPVTFIHNNVAVATTMLEFAREAKPQAFIQISTDEVYGPSGPDYAHPEWSPILPSNPYSASKACQEAIAIAYWRTYGVPVIITNTMNNFGQMQQDQKYPVMIQKKVAAGETVTVHGKPGNIGSRYYLHSRNHSDALLWILNNTTPSVHKPGEIDRPDRYNIVGDRRLDNLELAQTIASLMRKPLTFELVDFHSTRPGHDSHYGLDGSKLTALGWKAPVSFEESLRTTIEWQQANPNWINPDRE